MEVAARADVIQIFKVCDKCKEGYMMFTNNTVPSIVGGYPKFVHKCTKCGNTFNYDNRYPKMTLIPIEEPRPIEEFFTTTNNETTGQESEIKNDES